MPPLTSDAFTIDATDAHAYLFNFFSVKQKAKAKIKEYDKDNNELLDIKSLRDHYLGVIVYAMEITVADNIINTQLYSGENNSLMWWDVFDKKMTT